MAGSGRQWSGQVILHGGKNKGRCPSRCSTNQRRAYNEMLHWLTPFIIWTRGLHSYTRKNVKKVFSSKLCLLQATCWHLKVNPARIIKTGIRTCLTLVFIASPCPLLLYSRPSRPGQAGYMFATCWIKNAVKNFDFHALNLFSRCLEIQHSKSKLSAIKCSDF